MVIWLQPSAMPKIDIFKISLFSHQNNYFAILLIFNTQPWLKLLKNYELLCFKNFSQSWKKLVETKVENAVNSRNDSIFQIPNSPLYPQTSMLNLARFCCQKSKTFRFCCQKPKTLPTTWICGERGFFTAK